MTFATKNQPREWLSLAFSPIEDIIYVGLGVLLACVAIALLVTEIGFFIQYIFAGSLPENIVLLLDRILLIIIFVEVLYTVEVSLRQRVLQPGPFLVVGLIGEIRRTLVLTAELPKIAKEKGGIISKFPATRLLSFALHRTVLTYRVFPVLRGGKILREEIGHPSHYPSKISAQQRPPTGERQ